MLHTLKYVSNNDSSYIGRRCKDNKNDNSDNIWHQFLFPADKTVPSEIQSNSDLESFQ